MATNGILEKKDLQRLSFSVAQFVNQIQSIKWKKKKIQKMENHGFESKETDNMNKVTFTFSLLATVAFGTAVNYGIYQQRQITNIKNQLELSEQRNKINEDQLNEFVYASFNRMNSNDIELAKNQGRSEALLTYIKEPEQGQEFHDIWHDGYYQGLEQNKFIAKNSYTEGYHLGIDHALRDAGIDHPFYDDSILPKQKIEEVSEEDAKGIVKFNAKVRSAHSEDFQRKIEEYIEQQEEKGDPEKK